jgi:hypothetical protein
MSRAGEINRFREDGFPVHPSPPLSRGSPAVAAQQLRYSDEMVLPSVCPPLVFLCVLALAIFSCSFAGSKKMKKLAGNSSARPPTLVMMMGSLILPTH